MTIKDGFIAFAQKHNLPLKEKNENGSTILSFFISGEKGKYDAYAMCIEEERMLAFFVDCNIRVEEKNRNAAREYLMKLNYTLKIGSFQMDPSTGDITVRACQYILGNDQEQKNMIEQIVLIGGMIADNYSHDIIKHLE